MKTLCVLIVALMTSNIASAQEQTRFACTNGSLTRVIEIKYETGVTVPCEVHYSKPDEGQTEAEVLWRARNEAGYCEARTADFVERLQDLGWVCSGAAAPADDTEALEPSNDTDGSDENGT